MPARRTDSASAWLVAYLLLILTFATIYTIIPADFYHTMIRREPAFGTETSALTAALDSALVDATTKHEVDVSTGHGEVRGWMSFSDLGVEENGDVSFTASMAVLHYQPQRFMVPTSIRVTIRSDVLLPATMLDDMVRTTGNGIYALPITISPVAGPQVPSAVIMDLWKPGIARVYPGEYAMLPISLVRRIAAFRTAALGVSESFPGTFGRMLYFSVVTVATLGYGDVLPVTRRARFLAGLEALLGILLAGGFVNAMTKRRPGTH